MTIPAVLPLLPPAFGSTGTSSDGIVGTVGDWDVDDGGGEFGAQHWRSTGPPQVNSGWKVLPPLQLIEVNWHPPPFIIQSVSCEAHWASSFLQAAVLQCMQQVWSCPPVPVFAQRDESAPREQVRSSTIELSTHLLSHVGSPEFSHWAEFFGWKHQ